MVTAVFIESFVPVSKVFNFCLVFVMFILSLLLLFKFVLVRFANQVISDLFFFVCFQVDVIISEWMVSLTGSFFYLF